MINTPKEISRIINTLTKNGYDAYCAGQCVMAAYLGEESQDWDLYTDCPQEELRMLFPEGEALGRRVTRLDYTEEVTSDDLNVADYLDGFIADVVTLQGTMEEQLKVYDFTAEAIAEHPQKSPIDPYNGREDIKKKLLKPIGDIEAAFEKSPIKMFKAFKYVAIYNFDLSKALSHSISQKGPLLMSYSKEERLDYFTVIINGDYAGKALKMIGDLGLIPTLVGTKAKIEKAAVKTFEGLTENIHKIKHVPIRRMALFYLCFERNYVDAAGYLPHRGEDRELLLSAQLLLQNIYFLTSETAIKKYLNMYGWDKYHFADKLSKAYVIVFERDDHKIVSREHILKKVLEEKQPIFVEDLAIDADDIIEAGITDDWERAEYLLNLLPEVVHQKPRDNERKVLLKYVEKYNKSKISAALRGVKWLR